NTSASSTVSTKLEAWSSKQPQSSHAHDCSTSTVTVTSRATSAPSSGLTKATGAAGGVQEPHVVPSPPPVVLHESHSVHEPVPQAGVDARHSPQTIRVIIDETNRMGRV